jgi:hypothetical protein
MKKITHIILILLFSSITFSQQNDPKSENKLKSQNQLETEVYGEIESGIREGTVSGVAKYFGSQTYFSFSNGINGYYSSNQAFYVLEDFFKLYKVTSFKFDHIKSDKTSSYATGKYGYDHRGKRGNAQVYISLKKIGNNWNITQLTIN